MCCTELKWWWALYFVCFLFHVPLLIITGTVMETLICLTAGHNFTLAEMRGIFKGGVREPDWQTVSNKLKLNLHGQVSVVEFYQAWCKLGPSWENLSLALGKLQGYQRVIEQVKKKAGTYGCCTLLPSLVQKQYFY